MAVALHQKSNLILLIVKRSPVPKGGKLRLRILVEAAVLVAVVVVAAVVVAWVVVMEVVVVVAVVEVAELVVTMVGGVAGGEDDSSTKSSGYV